MTDIKEIAMDNINAQAEIIKLSEALKDAKIDLKLANETVERLMSLSVDKFEQALKAQE